MGCARGDAHVSLRLGGADSAREMIRSAGEPQAVEPLSRRRQCVRATARIWQESAIPAGLSRAVVQAQGREQTTVPASVLKSGTGAAPARASRALSSVRAPHESDEPSPAGEVVDDAARRDEADRDGAARPSTPDGSLAHRMTSSARTSNDCGSVRPSALAVLRLIASSNVVGCSTGRSPGFEPLRTLST